MQTDALTQDNLEEDGASFLPSNDEMRADATLDDLGLDARTRKAQDFKVEAPLTPPMFSELPSKNFKSVTFSDIHKYIPVLPSPYGHADEILSQGDDFAAFYEQVKPLTEAANRMIENERLSEADTTKRVEVPDLDFTPPSAPWDEYRCKVGSNATDGMRLDAQMKFLLQVKRSHIGVMGTWHGLSKLNRELPLAPFATHTAKITINEKLHGDVDANKFLQQLNSEDIATSSTDLWKRDGLRILEDSEDDEDELEPLGLEDDTDMMALVKKRKLEIDETISDSLFKRLITNTESLEKNEAPGINIAVQQVRFRGDEIQPSQVAVLPPTRPLKKAYTDVSRDTVSQKENESDRGLMFGGRFFASSALENFMTLHGMASAGLGTAKHTQSTPDGPRSASREGNVQPKRNAVDHSLRSTQAENEPSVQPQTALLQLPPVPNDLLPCSFILSSDVLQRQSLVRLIQKLYPNMDLVSRDFDVPLSPSKEADILLSPSTGLMIATLQQIKQRALPGQPDMSPIRDRILSLQWRYERLVVIVSEGLRQEMEQQGSSRPIDPRDKEAIGQLERFTYGIEGEVIVKYVQGGEQALARSIVVEMAEYGLPHGSKDIGDIRPLPDQTTVSG